MSKRLALLMTGTLLCVTAAFGDLLPSIDVPGGKSPVIYENKTADDMTITVQATAGSLTSFVKTAKVTYEIPATTTKACPFKVRPSERVTFDCFSAKGTCKYSIDPYTSASVKSK